MKKQSLLLASLLIASPAFSADEQPRKVEEFFTQTLISMPSLLAQHIEYSAVSQAGRECKLFTDKEVNYWMKLWVLSIEVTLSQHESEEFNKRSISNATLQKLERRTNYFLGIGCGSPELTSKIRDMKKRMRLAGFSLPQLSNANAEAVMDLYKEPNN